MFKFLNKGFTNSVFFKLLSLLIVLIPIVGMFIYNNYQTRDTLLNQVKSTHQNMLDSYWIQIDNQINRAVIFAVDTAWFEADPQLALSNDESVSALAKQRIIMDLSQQLMNFENIVDTLFVYTDGDFLSSSQKNQKDEERNAIKTSIINIASNLNFKETDSVWEFIHVDDFSGLVHVIKGDNGVLTGVYLNLDRLVSTYAPKDATASLFAIANKDKKSFLSNTPHQMLTIVAPSTVIPVSFVETLPSKNVLKSLPFLQKYMIAVSVIVALLIPFAIYMLRIIVIQPLHKLNKAMKHLQRGDLHYRIPPYRVSNEFAIVNQTFNQMIDEVRQLKINIYEEEIKSQKSQLRNLQLQIQPHFIINSLNMVYNLLENGDTRNAKKLIVHSVDFYRYMVKVDIDFVPLYEELQHVNTYLEIQSIRYRDKFTYSIETDQMVSDMLVPPMLIQNFIENSMKYAISDEKKIHISINIHSFEVDFYPFAKIVIADTGSGYPLHQIELLNNGSAIIDHNGEHIGIRNSVQRLSLLFHDQAKWNFYNHNGAVSELTIPALFTK